MNLLGENQTIKTAVPVIDRKIVTIIDQVFYDHDRDFVDVQYSFDADFYASDDVEWLNADRLRVFERCLRDLVRNTLRQIIRWEEFKNATTQ